MAAHSQSIPTDLRKVLTGEFVFSENELRKVESGQPVGKLLTSASPDDLRLIGAVLIEVDSPTFIRAYKDIVHFEVGKEVRRAGKFSEPPALADLKDFHWPDLNQKDVLACKPGRCDYKLPASVMQEFKTKLDWSAHDASAQADALIRQIWIDYLNRYRQQGDRALTVYYDTESPFAVADGLKKLIDTFPVAREKLPELVRYLTQYPQAKPAGVEEFFYWQEAAFGLKPVIRTSHVIIQELPREGGSHYAIASKMLFASHYFRAGLEFKYVYPVRTSAGKPAVYFVTYQRSYVDGMTGLTGSVLRKIAPGRSQASLIENLRLAKQGLEGRVTN